MSDPIVVVRPEERSIVVKTPGPMGPAGSGGGGGGAVDSVDGRDGDVTLDDLYQPLDDDLTDLAGIDSSTAGTIGTTGSGWVHRTWAQVKTALGLTKSDVGLSNVDNTSDANKPISTATQTALDAKADLVGGTVPSAQLPSFVDDVLEYADFASLPGTGTTGKIYVTIDTGKTYRWSGSAYTEISASLALGETSATAYRGDRGKTAYDHSQVTGNPHGTVIGDISGLQTALDGKADDSDLNSYVAKSLFDAFTIAYADTDNTPAALTVGASTFVGRKASGGIAAMTVAEVRTLITADNGKGYVNHGATAGTARPSGFASIEWHGSVEPTNAVNGDTWVVTP